MNYSQEYDIPIKADAITIGQELFKMNVLFSSGIGNQYI